MSDQAPPAAARFRITGVGKALPERVVTNDEIAARLGVDAGWILGRTGIVERRFASDGDSAASLGASAAGVALARSALMPADIDLVLVATCTPDYIFPPSATIIQDRLGIGSRAGAFDLSAACSGFAYGLAAAGGFIGTGIARRVLLVGVDLLSRHLNLDDPVTAPLFGDGAGAVVIEADPEAEPAVFELGADGSCGEHVIIPGSGSRLAAGRASAGDLPEKLSCIRMTGRDVYRNAVKTMTAQGKSLGEAGFDLLVAHQANKRILIECADQLGIDHSKVFMNIDRYGNTSAGSVPIALTEAWEQGYLSPGNRLLMLAFGAGYTWGGAAMRWSMPCPVIAAPTASAARSPADGSEANADPAVRPVPAAK